MPRANPYRERFLASYTTEDFSRQDESDDALFYERPRLVAHLDERALHTVERLLAQLVIEPDAEVLDLMASWDSHLSPLVATRRVVGLGLNRSEMEANERLDEILVHDLNQDPALPFADESFDVVLNVVSVDYLTRPLTLFDEVSRVLRPGGLFAVVFSNRLFSPKATRLWRETGEAAHIDFVVDCFHAAQGFEKPHVFIVKGEPRPAQDKYARLGVPSDPVITVYAERAGQRRCGGLRPSPAELSKALLPASSGAAAPTIEALAEAEPTIRCPHCQQQMLKWRVPQTPFTEWDQEFMYICFNDSCPYLQRGWSVMSGQGNHGFSYRMMFNPERLCYLPVPVPTLGALRDGIVSEP